MKENKNKLGKDVREMKKEKRKKKTLERFMIKLNF
jgi:hypothetical protein